MSMVHCRGCGQSIHESAATCPHCGAPQGFGTAAGAVLAPLPAGVAGWSWGAFLLNWLWAAFNSVWIGLLALVPFVGLVMAIVLGFKGREWAWRAKRWDSVEHFQRVQRKWSAWGVGLIVLPMTIGVVAAIALPAYQDYVKRARQATAQIEAAEATRVAAAAEAAEQASRREEAAHQSARRAEAAEAERRAQEIRMAQQAAQRVSQPEPPATGVAPPATAALNDLLPEARNCASAVDCATLMLQGAFPRRADIVQAAASSLGNLPKPVHGDRKVARDLNKRALTKFGENDHGAAVEILKLAAQADPADPEILSNLGLALVKAGRANEAEIPLLAALELDPRRSSAWAPLAEALAMQQKAVHGQRALLLAYEFSANKQKTLDFYRARNQAAELPEIQRDMYAKALEIVESGY